MKVSKIWAAIGVAAGIGLALILWQSKRTPEPSSKSASGPVPAAPEMVSNSAAGPVAADPEVSGDERPDRPVRGGQTSREEDNINELVGEIGKWAAMTDGAAGDKLTPALEAQITDSNASAIVRALPPELLETSLGLMALKRWAASDRMGAVNWIGGRSAPTKFQIATAVRGWVAQDSEAVHTYLGGLPPGPWKEKVLTEISQDAMNSADPMEALTMLREMQPGETQTRMVKDACIQWAQADPESTVSWVSKVDDPKLKNQLISAAALGSAYSDPQGAAEWASRELPPGEESDSTLGYVVRLWSETSSPDEAAKWVARQPAGSTRETEIKELIAQWKQSDNQALTRWANSLPAGPLRQDVARQLAAGQAATTP